MYLSPFCKTMRPEMLAKTAETNALKRGFPNDTEGLELAAIEAETRAKQPGLAQRYDEIFGTDEDMDLSADLPPSALPEGTATNNLGQTVETRSGEVLPDGDAEQAQDGATPEPKVRPQIGLWQRNRELVIEAEKRHLTGVPTLSSRSSQDAIATANAELKRRIEQFDLDRLAEQQSQEAF
jgi:hypothetical protein